MTSVALSGGQVLLIDGAVGLEQDCCCGSGSDESSGSSAECPPGCPDVTGCNLVIVRDFGDVQIEDVNAPAEFFSTGNGCQYAFNISDLPSEQGGDIEVIVTLSHDENCGIATAVQVTFSDPELAESLPTVTATIECNPLP